VTTTIWLRVSAVISLLFSAGHTLGGLKYWSPMGDNPVLQSMRSVRFDTMHVTRSYLDFYLGFGYSLSALLLMQSILLWQFAGIAKTAPQSLRPMILAVGIATLVAGVIAWRFLFPLPAVVSAVLAGTLAAAYRAAR